MPQVGDIEATALVVRGRTELQGDQKAQAAVYTADGAISEKSGVVLIGGGGAKSMTLAAPIEGEDDGKMLIISAITAQAHTVTQATPEFNGIDDGNNDVATFGGAIGDSMVIVAYGGVWYVVNLRNVTIA